MGGKDGKKERELGGWRKEDRGGVGVERKGRGVEGRLRGGG